MKYFVTVLATVLALACAALCGYVVWRDYDLWVIAVAVAMIIALPLSSFLHELGHVLMGAACKIKAVPSFSFFGSSCCKLVPKTATGLRARLFFTALGGVLMNLLIAAIVVAVVRIFKAPSWLTFLVPANVYLCVLNICPAQFNSGATDGLICNELLNNTDTAKVMIAVLTVQARVLGGKPIEEQGELLFGVPQISEDNESFIALTELRYEYFKAKGDNEEAQKYLTRFNELKEEYM